MMNLEQTMAEYCTTDTIYRADDCIMAIQQLRDMRGIAVAGGSRK